MVTQQTLILSFVGSNPRIPDKINNKDNILNNISQGIEENTMIKVVGVCAFGDKKISNIIGDCSSEEYESYVHLLKLSYGLHWSFVGCPFGSIDEDGNVEEFFDDVQTKFVEALRLASTEVFGEFD